MSGSNIRETADLKDVIATGKRSQVTRLVCGPLLVILSIGNEKAFQRFQPCEVNKEVFGAA